LSLSTSADRAAVFAEARGSAPFYDERLKLWIVLDPEQVSELLLDERLVVPEVAAALRTVENHYGISLPNLRWIAAELPLVLNGEAHKRARSRMAKLISTDKRTGGPWREAVVATVRSALATAGTVEAVRALLFPAVNAVFTSLSHIDAAFEPLILTRVFDHYASYRQLMAAEAGVATLRARAVAAGIPDDVIGVHAATMLIGRDSLLASFSEGLIDFALACRGRRLDDPAMRAPRLLGGVTVGERLVERAFSYNGAEFEPGQRLRLYFQGYGYYESETQRLAMFGTGAHSCLGRALALDVWSVFAAELCKIPLVLRSIEHEYARNSMFTMPKYINLELAQP
jgi:hypothetical protein